MDFDAEDFTGDQDEVMLAVRGGACHYMYVGQLTMFRACGNGALSQLQHGWRCVHVYFYAWHGS